MPVKRVEVPDDLKYLLPSLNTKSVVVGEAVYDVAPLTELQMEGAIDEITNILATVSNDVIELLGPDVDFANADTTPEQRQLIMNAMKSSLSRLVKSGSLVKLISTLVGIDEEEVRSNITIPQLHHMAGVLWEQNFDFQRAPDGAAKNVSSLLETFGFGKNEAKVYRWANVVLTILLEDTDELGSLEERVRIVLDTAYECGLLSERPAVVKENLALERKSTLSSESTTVSPPTSLEDIEKLGASSQEQPAPEDTQTSANVPLAAATSTPSGLSQGVPVIDC